MERLVGRLALVGALAVFSLLTAPAPPALATHTVDPLFAEYYYAHDGPRVLGPAISPREGTVQYFEKGRLEDHRGTGVPAPWAFMLGRLAADLVEAGAPLPVAGESGPTYADLRELAAPGQRRAPPAPVDGVQALPEGVFVPYDSRLWAAPGHVVPSEFWAYITDPRLFPAGWLHDVGLPLTAAVRASVAKAGQARTIMLQAFERTVLTYDWENPAGWQLERANVGVHYLAHRAGAGPGPAPGFPGWRGEYFANAELSGVPALVRGDAVIDFDWGEGAPAAGLPADYFSARWTRALHVDEEGTYHVSVRADDGVRVWVAGRQIIDHWRSTRRVDGYILLDPGDHTIRVEYRELEGNAHIELDLDRIDDYPNWKGEYYDNLDLDGPPFFIRNDERIDFDWESDSPGSGLPRSHFSVRWTRKPSFTAGTYRFTVTADDGVRLYVDGKKVLDQWRREGDVAIYTMDIAMKGGHRSVRLDYRDHGGEARVKLTYSRL